MKILVDKLLTRVTKLFSILVFEFCFIDYGFEYSDESQEEDDVDIENQV